MNELRPDLEDLDGIVRASLEAVRRNPHAVQGQLARELTEQALYVEALRYALTAQQVRAGESSQEQLQARQRVLGDVALEYAHARGWQPPAGWQPLPTRGEHTD